MVWGQQSSQVAELLLGQILFGREIQILMR